MRKLMKSKFLIIVSFFAVSFFVFAEQMVYIYKKDGTKVPYVAATLDSIGFVELDANSHEYVDLGLPSGTLWSTCSVGGALNSVGGEYYAWGEIETKENYNENNYKWYSSNNGVYTKYNLYADCGVLDNIEKLELCDDAASVKWGGNWRIPTKQDWQELVENCSYTFYSTNIVGGDYYIMKSKINGNTIKIYEGEYWCSDTGQNFTSYAGCIPIAWYQYFFSGSSGSIYFKYDYRWTKKLIRPVMP